MKIQISILLSYIVTCPFESSFIYRSKVNPVGYLLYCENKKIQGDWIFQGDSFRNKPRLRRGYFPIGKGWSGEKFYTGKSRGLKSFTPAHEKSFSRGVFLIRPGPSPALLNFNRYHARSHLARIKISRASPASILFLSPWIIERDQPLYDRNCGSWCGSSSKFNKILYFQSNEYRFFLSPFLFMENFSSFFPRFFRINQVQRRDSRVCGK